MKDWNNFVTYVALIGLMGVGLLSQQNQSELRAIASGSSVQPLPPATTNTPRLLKFSLSLFSPQDLKVKQGDTIAVGEVLAERVEERSRLTTQRQSLELSFKQIQARIISAPPAPIPVPTVKNLPPISYVEEEAAIAAAATNLQQAEKALVLQKNLKTEPLEVSEVKKAALEVQNKERLLNNQRRKIDTVATLKNLPDAVALHEQEVLASMQTALQQAQAEHQQAQGKLSAAQAAQAERLSSLKASVLKARADYQLALAKLQTKKDARAYTEYEASVAAARRIEERNQSVQNYFRALQEVGTQERDRSFQLAQIQAKIAEVDDKLKTLSVVTSPYAGTVRRIKIVQQQDNNLSAELTLAVNAQTNP